MAKLVIYEALDSEETIFEDFELSSHRIVIGSSEDSHLVLDMPDIDPAHASLELRNDQWVIQDLGGPGGTVLNGLQIDGPHHLEHNDLIELNSLKMRFYEIETVTTPERVLPSVNNEAEVAAPIKGRVWFSAVAGITLAIIFAIVLMLVVADYLDLLKISDLIPFLS